MPSGQTETMKDASNNTVATTTLSYTYDSLGNIETISEGGVQRQKYYYDSLNQLIREDNLDLNKTIVYSYDLGGNITSTSEYAYQTGSTVTGTPTATNTYTYGDSNWKDKLTAYNGNTITYDQIGNPLSYYNGFSFTWQKGRQLASASNGTTSVSYTYNNDGYRTAKTVNGTEIKYTLEGDKVLFELNGDVELRYFYDAAGAPIAFSMGSDPVLYLYRKNLQGYITGIYSGSTGTLLVSYVYNAWGMVTATDVAQTTESGEVLNYNPYLYRGYRYDAETGLYYVSSRYYDPDICRFINADDASYLGASGDFISYNLFAYCGNNPVTGYDPDGTLDWGNLFKGSGWLAVGVTAIAVGVSVLTCGVAAPAMMAVAAVTVAAGAATVVNGVSELGEVATGHNFMRDDVFRGNANAYNTYAHTTAAVAEIGTMVCGGWLKTNSPRIKAYKSMDTYNVKGKHLSSGNGNWSKFNTTSQAELRTLGKEAIKNSPMGSLYPNSADSYRLIYDFGG